MQKINSYQWTEYKQKIKISKIIYKYFFHSKMILTFKKKSKYFAKTIKIITDYVLQLNPCS